MDTETKAVNAGRTPAEIEAEIARLQGELKAAREAALPCKVGDRVCLMGSVVYVDTACNSSFPYKVRFEDGSISWWREKHLRPYVEPGVDTVSREEYERVCDELEAARHPVDMADWEQEFQCRVRDYNKAVFGTPQISAEKAWNDLRAHVRKLYPQGQGHIGDVTERVKADGVEVEYTPNDTPRWKVKRDPNITPMHNNAQSYFADISEENKLWILDLFRIIESHIKQVQSNRVNEVSTQDEQLEQEGFDLAVDYHCKKLYDRLVPTPKESSPVANSVGLESNSVGTSENSVGLAVAPKGVIPFVKNLEQLLRSETRDALADQVAKLRNCIVELPEPEELEIEDEETDRFVGVKLGRCFIDVSTPAEALQLAANAVLAAEMLAAAEQKEEQP